VIQPIDRAPTGEPRPSLDAAWRGRWLGGIGSSCPQAQVYPCERVVASRANFRETGRLPEEASGLAHPLPRRPAPPGHCPPRMATTLATQYAHHARRNFDRPSAVRALTTTTPNRPSNAQNFGSSPNRHAMRKTSSARAASITGTLDERSGVGNRLPPPRQSHLTPHSAERQHEDPVHEPFQVRRQAQARAGKRRLPESREQPEDEQQHAVPKQPAPVSVVPSSPTRHGGAMLAGAAWRRGGEPRAAGGRMNPCRPRCSRQGGWRGCVHQGSCVRRDS